MTAEEEAEAARLVQAELADLEADGEVELEAEAAEEPAAAGAEAEAAAIDVDVEVPEEEPQAASQPPQQPTPLPPKPPQPKPQQPAPEVPPAGEAAGKASGKGVGNWKGQQAKGKGKGASPGKGKSETFFGLVHQVGEKTGNMLVKSWKVSERYGQEAMIPKLANPAGAVLGDKISFEVLEREDGARPLAVNIQVRGHVDLSATGAQAPANELRRQVLYYLSDDNLRTDKFFQGIIASNEGGWISMTTILGCPRMKQMKATCEGVFAALRGATEVELREAPAGEEALRRTSPPPPLDTSNVREWGGGPPKGQAKGQAKGEAKGEFGKGKGEPRAKGEARPSLPAGEPCEDVYYAGVVKSQMRMEPRKLFISCDEISQAFGRDAYFLPSQKPKAVEVGSLVVFAVPADSEVGFSPQASFVAQLAPLGSLGREEAEEEPASNGAGAGAGASRGPGVQKTIFKKGGGR